jgi:hypothetical protein
MFAVIKRENINELLDIIHDGSMDVKIAFLAPTTPLFVTLLLVAKCVLCICVCLCVVV